MVGKPFWSGKDAVGREVTLQARPERVISVVPSQTELLIDLGIGPRLIGRTRYCIHPEGRVETTADVGGTKRVEMAKIEALRPDFFLAEKEENPKEMVEALAELAPVYVTDVASIASAIAMCKTVGKLTGLPADDLASRIETAMAGVRGIAERPERVLYLIWKKPWMAAGRGTFIHDCLAHIGFENAVSATRYPELTPEAIRELNPDRVFLSSEPYPFKPAHFAEIQTLLPNARLEIVDGELFSWYGSRMLKMPEYWRTLG